MALMRWRPMRDLVSVQDEINRMFEEFTGRSDDVTRQMQISPASDIVEDKDSYTVAAELPGMKKEDVKVTVQNNVLSISGEKKREVEQKDRTFHRVERSYGSFYRTFELPVAVDTTNIQAEFNDGILKIKLPKSEVAKAKEIAINVK